MRGYSKRRINREKTRVSADVLAVQRGCEREKAVPPRKPLRENNFGISLWGQAGKISLPLSLRLLSRLGDRRRKPLKIPKPSLISRGARSGRGGEKK